MCVLVHVDTLIQEQITSVLYYTSIKMLRYIVMCPDVIDWVNLITKHVRRIALWMFYLSP